MDTSTLQLLVEGTLKVALGSLATSSHTGFNEGEGMVWGEMNH